MSPDSFKTELEIALEQIASFSEYFGKLLGYSPFRQLQNISLEYMRECERLMLNKGDLTILALGCRNVIELYLISRHIISDKKYLDNWTFQADKDSTDIMSGLIDLINSRELDDSEAQEILSKHVEKSKCLAVPKKGQFDIKLLAEKYGFLADYKSIHKLCSKLIHPTSGKVNFYSSFHSSKDYHEVLRLAAQYFIDLFIKHCESIQYYDEKT